MYYLQSRYYNPEWGRFINADKIAAVTGELLSANMFAYCINNPVNMSDSTGYKPVFETLEEEQDYKAWLHQQRTASNNESIISSFIDSFKQANDIVSSNNKVLILGALITFGGMEFNNKLSKSFPENPSEFNPKGLRRFEIGDKGNGRIIKWLDDTKKAIFEWNEDLKAGEHYHITPDGRNRIPHPVTGNTHIKAGDPIPDEYMDYFK